ncbi:Uncharacterized protein dnm_021150 [Desulfonema magnum]|uniref:Uncharacterized protein n=1 Tax=Desulfonema magnum TaxID=45655 RepID=A0A975GLT1_9BACT|nr:Uncharacterized protein dnm_021150 [Desulfonema magnum]
MFREKSRVSFPAGEKEKRFQAPDIPSLRDSGGSVMQMGLITWPDNDKERG